MLWYYYPGIGTATTIKVLLLLVNFRKDNEMPPISKCCVLNVSLYLTGI